MGISRQECWSGLPFPTPGDLPDPMFEPRCSAQVNSQDHSHNHGASRPWSPLENPPCSLQSRYLFPSICMLLPGRHVIEPASLSTPSSPTLGSWPARLSDAVSTPGRGWLTWPPPPSQDTYAAPLWAGAVSLGSAPGQGQTVFPDLGGAVDSLAPLHQSMRPWHSPLATSLKPRTYCDMCCYGGVGDLRSFPVPPELGQENVGLGGRGWECRHSGGWAQLIGKSRRTSRGRGYACCPGVQGEGSGSICALSVLWGVREDEGSQAAMSECSGKENAEQKWRRPHICFRWERWWWQLMFPECLSHAESLTHVISLLLTVGISPTGQWDSNSEEVLWTGPGESTTD